MIYSRKTTFGRFGRAMLILLVCTLFVSLSVANAAPGSPGHDRPKGAGKAERTGGVKSSAIFSPDEWPVFRITQDNSQKQGQPTFAVDSNGNIHVVYVDGAASSEGELYYKMVDGNGSTLIPPIRLTADDGVKTRNPYIAADSNNNIHIVWQDWRSSNMRSYYMKLNPYADDRNGNATTLATIKVVADKIVSRDMSGSKEYVPRIAIDKYNNVHLVYTDTDIGSAWYRQLDNNGNGLTPFVNLGEGSYHASNGIDTDSIGNVHILMTDFSTNVWYTMLDGSGHILIDKTAINDIPGG